MLQLSKTFSRLIGLILMFGLGSVQAQSGKPENALPELTNLQAVAQEAKQKNLPIMLMFGATWCDFCHTLRHEVLDPMELGGLYQGKYVVMRHIVIDHELTMPGFDGKPLNMRTWSDNIHADLTPTLVFFDSQGKEIAPRIVGISNLDMYAALIHQRLNLGYQALNNPIRLPAMPEQLK
ncbi:thioredoxin family protein [Thiosulfativibrio zosterae]|uniref:Thioredoxin-like fold domain-containing protein n=1 Tax=Thiosulfativibrio zosterae TaxID=2675053 RepID=A0A6F8PJU6_9GAMM|nr:thioredoxin family protein [Thiosulfativibrio zosterae]BBP42372.1 hypothetical protein THMIRHAT_01180 [Thiosulfativibrio zosterae]